MSPSDSPRAAHEVVAPDEDLVADALARRRAEREAQRRLDEESRPQVALPPLLTLEDRIARPRVPIAFRIEGWQPTNARVVLAAQFKAGKTTTRDNLVRCLVDGEPWLGSAAVKPLTGRVTILDNEMSESQAEDWLISQNIQNPDRVVLCCLRGAVATFNILDPTTRAEWAQRLRALDTEYLIFDCLRPVLDALGLNEHTEAGVFLVAFDELLKEAGISEALVVHHMGHQGDRARGDSRIRDWPDAEWRLVRASDDPASQRRITAYGRDVDIAESDIVYDPTTRHLTLLEGSHRDRQAQETVQVIKEWLRANGEASKNKIETAMTSEGISRQAVRDALEADDPEIRHRRGPRGAVMFYLAERDAQIH